MPNQKFLFKELEDYYSYIYVPENSDGRKMKLERLYIDLLPPEEMYGKFAMVGLFSSLQPPHCLVFCDWWQFPNLPMITGYWTWCNDIKQDFSFKPQINQIKMAEMQHKTRTNIKQISIKYGLIIERILGG